MTGPSLWTIMRSEKTSGFTLIEVVAALAVVSIALLGLLRLHLLSIAAADKATSVTAAALIARERMTEAICSGYPPVGIQSGETGTDGSRLTWQTEVTDVPSSQAILQGLSLRGLRKISVDVAWGQPPRQKHIRMTTYAAESRIHAK